MVYMRVTHGGKWYSFYPYVIGKTGVATEHPGHGHVVRWDMSGTSFDAESGNDWEQAQQTAQIRIQKIAPGATVRIMEV